MREPGWAGVVVTLAACVALIVVREVMDAAPLLSFAGGGYNSTQALRHALSMYKRHIGMLQVQLREMEQELEDARRVRDEIEEVEIILGRKDAEMKKCQGAGLMVEQLLRQLGETGLQLANATAETWHLKSLLGSVSKSEIVERERQYALSKQVGVVEACVEQGFLTPEAADAARTRGVAEQVAKVRKTVAREAARGVEKARTEAYALAVDKVEGELAAGAAPHMPPETQLGDIQWAVDTAEAIGALGPDGGLGTRKSPFSRDTDAQEWDDLAFKELGGTPNDSLPVPAYLLKELHHHSRRSPWVHGREAFDFLAASVSLRPNHRVLELGCGPLSAGVHFVRYLRRGRYHCVESHAPSVAAALTYELPVNGLLDKRPQLVLTGSLGNLTEVEGAGPFDLVFADSVLIKLKREVVWKTLRQVSPLLAPGGRLYVSHNLKWCEPADSESGCNVKYNCDPPPTCPQLSQAGLQFNKMYVLKSRFFEQEDRWFEFEPSTEEEVQRL